MPIVEEQVCGDYLEKNNITAITLDTSIFIGSEKRVLLGSTKFRLFEEQIKISPLKFVLSGTVKNEVLSHLKNFITNSFLGVKKSIREALNAYGTVKPTRECLLNQITRGFEIEDIAKDRLQDFITETDCEVILDEKYTDLASINRDYFAKKPPFSNRKKSEFPDAFALNALEAKAEKENIKMLVVSNDGDWKDFCEKSQRLYLVNKIDRALALIVDSPLYMKTLVLHYLSDDIGREDLKYHLEKEVNEVEYNVDGYPSFGQMEVNPWQLELDDFSWSEDKDDIDIIEMEEHENNSIRIAVTIPITLEVEYNVEVSFYFYDTVDKDTIDYGGRGIDRTEELEINPIIVLTVESLGKPNEKIVIHDCELDPIYPSIDLGEIDVFREEK